MMIFYGLLSRLIYNNTRYVMCNGWKAGGGGVYSRDVYIIHSVTNNKQDFVVGKSDFV